MSVERSKSFRQVALAGLFALTSMGWAGLGRAQDHTADPYKPYNQQYEQFVFPSYPSGFGLTPNQNLLERGGYTAPNQFQRFLDSDLGLGDEFGPIGSGRRRSGPGIPYYSAYRQYDKDYNRLYQPNLESDREYYQNQRSRHEKYIAYLKERDPRKRAELYRAYTKDMNKATRGLANPRGRAARDTNPGEATTPEDRAPGIGSRRRTSTAPPGARSTAPGLRQRKPSDILRESEELESTARPRTLTAPGLAPRSGPARPR